MTKNSPTIYFVLGTRAQFIKMAPIMYQMKQRALEYKLIYTAQHQENIEEILRFYGLNEPDLILFSGNEANTKYKFITWFIHIIIKIVFHAKSILPIKGIVITHGDTFSTWLAALLGKLAGSKVAHVESGLRSFNIFQPFPEELSRLFTFSLSDIYFCSDEKALSNVKSYKGLKINTFGNTLIDAVKFAIERPITENYSFQNKPFGLVSIHRYENIFTRRLSNFIIPTLLEIAQTYQLVFTLHPTMRERLIELSLYDELKKNKNIVLHERFQFQTWVHLCKEAEFVITDGGSNQEELSYIGVPALLFRNSTERFEGLGKNIILSNFDKATVFSFFGNLSKYKCEPQDLSHSPSKVIIDTITSHEKEK